MRIWNVMELILVVCRGIGARKIFAWINSVPIQMECTISSSLKFIYGAEKILNLYKKKFINDAFG